MAENNTESGQPEEQVQTPNEQVSAGGGDQQSSPVSEPQIAELSEVIKDLQGQVRALQGDKDRGIARVGKQVDELTKQLERYEAYRADGKDPAAALREMQIDALLGSQGEVSVPETTPKEAGGTASQESTVDTATILQATGLDANDADVLALIRDGAPAEQYIALAAKKKAQPETPPQPAQAMPVGGGTSVAEESIGDITAALQAEYAKTPMNMPKIRELKAKQEALLPKQ
jgi:hypothetical protein